MAKLSLETESGILKKRTTSLTATYRLGGTDYVLDFIKTKNEYIVYIYRSSVGLKQIAFCEPRSEFRSFSDFSKYVVSSIDAPIRAYEELVKVYLNNTYHAEGEFVV